MGQGNQDNGKKPDKLFNGIVGTHKRCGGPVKKKRITNGLGSVRFRLVCMKCKRYVPSIELDNDFEESELHGKSLP